MKFIFHPHFIFRTPLNPTDASCDDSIFNEAIYLSTPVFYEEYQKYLSKALIDDKEIKKINISLYKYQTRASHRCTPFGMFAGLSIGEWADETNITLDVNLKNTLVRRTRLDMNVLCNLSQELAKQDFIKPYLEFQPNNSIYLIGNYYRYVEYYYVNIRRYHKLNKVDYSVYLQRILDESKKNALTHRQLSTLLIDDEINEAEASVFIDELIKSQLLVHQLEPTLTGDDFFDVLQRKLKAININAYSHELSQIIDILTHVDASIKALDTSVFNTIDAYQNIYRKLKTILPNLSEINLFQTDLYKKINSNTTTTGILCKTIHSQLAKVILFLNKITPPTINKTLREFIKRFVERYEDYEVPLLIALDTETGIGYPTQDMSGINELVEDVFIMGNNNNEFDLKWNSIQNHLLRLITESIRHDKKIIELSETDFKDIDYSSGNLPSTFPIMFKVLNAETHKIEVGNIGGSSAINLLGRFAGGNYQLESIIKEISVFEQHQLPDKILAEIVHLPESRTGNILARPSFRAYEIPYLAKSVLEDDFQIKMDDLTLKVKGDNIILFDKRLQKEIIPRLGNAHYFSLNSLPIYNFLCDLQSQYFTKPYIGFNWGALANLFDFLPRVEFQNTVLSSARWKIRKDGLDPLKNKNKSDTQKHALFLELKNKLELPDKFLIADGDNELLIDCDNPIGIDTFIDIVKNRDEITLQEYLFEDRQSIIKDNDGNNFTNECIAIVLNENSVKQSSNLITSKIFSSKQVFSIGSEWLYYKIYCGAKTADYILTEKIKYITETLSNKEIIDKWFFIRYSDPDVHLRFRLHISNLKKFGDALQLVNSELEPLLNQHIISKIQTDTYKRELDRYGDNTIELVETLFHADSIFVTDMLDILDVDSGGTIRWQMALLSVDGFLNDFKLSAAEKQNLINTLSTTFFNEHGGKKELKLILDSKFRKLRTQIQDVLDYSNVAEKEYYPIIELINTRSKANANIIDEILLLNSNNQLQLSLNDLLASLLHMNLDRLFMGRNRTNEFIVYDLLARYYKSTLARSNTALKTDALLNS